MSTNIVNPKSIALFAAIFASSTPPHLSWLTFVAMLAVVAIVASCWYSFVAIMLSHRHIAQAYQRYRIAIDRMCGSAIVILGIRQLIR